MKIKGHYKLTVMEDFEVIQTVEQDNVIPVSVLEGLLSDIFDTTAADVQHRCIGHNLSFDGTDAAGYYGDTIGQYTPTGLELVKVSTNAIQIQDGPSVSSKSAYFDGSTGYYYQNFDNSILSTTHELWVKVAAAGTYTLWQYGLTNTSNVYGKTRLALASGVPQLYCYYGASGTLDTTASTLGALSLNKWHHIVGVRSTYNGTWLYVDGVLAARNPYYIANIAVTMYGYSLIGWSRINNAAPSWASQVAILTGSLANLTYYHNEGVYTGNTVGVKYFTPSKAPKSANNTGRFSTNSNFRPYVMFLSKDTTSTRFEGSRLDDHAYIGNQKDTTSVGIDLLVSSPDYTVSFERTSNSTVKISVMLNEGIATGEWRSLLLCDMVSRPFGYIDSYPKVSKIVFPQPISKRPNSTLLIEWTLSLSN